MRGLSPLAHPFSLHEASDTIQFHLQVNLLSDYEYEARIIELECKVMQVVDELRKLRVHRLRLIGPAASHEGTGRPAVQSRARCDNVYDLFPSATGRDSACSE